MLKVLFAGSPEIAVSSLLSIAKDFDLVGVLTNAPSAKGRSKALTPTPVGLVCENLTSQGHSVPVLTPLKLDEEVRNQVTSLNPDILVCFAYGHIFGSKFMSLFRLGGINFHPSLLPKYRGAAPIPFVILNQEDKTGFTVQTIAPKMDSGDIILQESYTLADNETTLSLTNLSSEKGARFLCKALSIIEEKGVSDSWIKQDDSQATFCTKIDKSMALIDWSDSAKAISAKIRAFNPWPGAYTTVIAQDGSSRTLFVWDAVTVESDSASQLSSACSLPGTVFATDKQKGVLIKTGDGVLAVKTLQWQSKKALDWKSFINGSRDFIGSTLGNTNETR